jgi:hypothetical protein
MVNISTKQQQPRMTHEEWKAFLQKFEDCTCTPGSALACESCREYNSKKYCGHIPFYVDGKEVVE